MASHNESEGIEPRNMSNRIGPRVSVSPVMVGIKALYYS